MAFPDTLRFIAWGVRIWAIRASAVLAIMAVLPALAQQPQVPYPEAAPPAESTGSIWSTKTAPGPSTDAQQSDDAAPPFVLTPYQIELLQEIDRYLNSLVNISGHFIQTDHRNEETSGRFYLKRPGRIRFDYRAPSKLRIVSDGYYLSVEDHDLKTIDKYPLDATPVRLLLGEDVNLARDADILDMRQDESAVVVVLRDRSETTSGELQLYFTLPELVLYEWVVTDAQGLETRIQLADLTVDEEERPDEFFQSSAIELENLDNN